MNKKNNFYKAAFQERSKNFFFWFLGCCFLSLIIHFVILDKISHFKIASFNQSTFDAIIPRRFQLKQVKIDPNLLKEPENKKWDVVPKVVELPLSEKKDFYSQNSISNKEIKPQPIQNNKLMKEEDDSILRENTIPESIPRPNQPLISIDSNTNESSVNDSFINHSNHASGYSELDQLIEQKTPLNSQTAPILLPTDLLFEYDADRLKIDAEQSLKKLAILIQRNPKAQFVVEGFTDSFGSDEYNLDLSTRRANSIKEWLINKEHINPNQIQSYGLGKTHFIVPSKGTIQQQSLNRRVEIVIHPNF